MLRGLTGRPTFGVLPWSRAVWASTRRTPSRSLRGRIRGRRWRRRRGGGLRVAVVPRAADVQLHRRRRAGGRAGGRGAVRRPTRRSWPTPTWWCCPAPARLCADLAWLRERGIGATRARRARRGPPVLGICGGFQMLARTIEDDVESRAGAVDGLGLLPVRRRFAGEDSGPSGRARRWASRSRRYEIHHGMADVRGGEPVPRRLPARPVWGTHWHGQLENDDFRRAFLAASRRTPAAPSYRRLTSRSTGCGRSSWTGWGTSSRSTPTRRSYYA